MFSLSRLGSLPGTRKRSDVKLEFVQWPALAAACYSAFREHFREPGDRIFGTQ